MPDELAGQVVEKGSITLDGASLTVASVGRDTFDVALIPHTLDVTTFGRLAPGDLVNVEVDVLARYVVGLLAAGRVGSDHGDPADDGPAVAYGPADHETADQPAGEPADHPANQPVNQKGGG